jgi:predicted dehydrogenase
VCDFNVKKINKVKKKYPGINFITDSKKIFKDSEINLISIASYDNYHFAHIKKSILNNKHIFVEKPMCLNYREFNSIKRLLKNKNKIKISSNFVLRGTGKFKKIKSLSKKVGKIFYLEGDYNYGRIEKITKGWRGKIPFYSVTLGGGMHLIDLMIWINNSPIKKVISLGNKITTKNSSFKFKDNVTSLLEFRNGGIGKLNSNFGGVMPHHHTLQVHGTKSTILSDFRGTTLFRSRNKKIMPKKINFSSKKFEKSYVLQSFIDDILGKRKSIISKLDIFDSMRVALAIEKSIKTKKWEVVK